MADAPAGDAILIVDDEPALCMPLAEFLRGLGLNATAMTEGAEALKRLREVPFAWLLLDLNMPHVNGLDLAREGSRLYPGTRLVFLTGELDSPDLRERLSEFPDAILLRKPFNLLELIALVRGGTSGRES